MAKGFDFGANWERYSERALNEDRVVTARAAFSQLIEGIDLESRTFLDVGFGQGLTSLCAASAGASVHSLDVNPKCLDALKLTGKFFESSVREKLSLTTGSILSEKIIVDLLGQSGGYHVVHAWGVLHHTGDLKQAFSNCVRLLAPRGYLIVAVYNRHWSSPLWKAIKRLYCALPTIGQKVLVGVLTPIIVLAKIVVRGKNPMDTQRGMDFFVDIVDWVGGYPYEYASIQEVSDLGAACGLDLMRVNPASVPTGCNEFIFFSSDSNRGISAELNK